MYIWNDFTGDYTDDKTTAVKTVFQFSIFNILRHSLGSNKLTQAFLSRVILFEIPSPRCKCFSHRFTNFIATSDIFLKNLQV